MDPFVSNLERRHLERLRPSRLLSCRITEYDDFGDGAGPAAKYGGGLRDVRWDGSSYDDPPNGKPTLANQPRYVHIPTAPDEEDGQRAFYIGLIGFVEVDAPSGAEELGGFWAKTTNRTIHFGPTAGPFALVQDVPTIVAPNLDGAIQNLVAAGHPVNAMEGLTYARRFSVIDPVDNEIILFGA